MLYDGRQTAENLVSTFLNNLNKLLRSNLIADDQKNTLFKIKNYLMLDLALLRIERFQPTQEKTIEFLKDIISSSGRIENQFSSERAGSVDAEIAKKNAEIEQMLAIYRIIKSKHFD